MYFKVDQQMQEVLAHGAFIFSLDSEKTSGAKTEKSGGYVGSVRSVFGILKQRACKESPEARESTKEQL